MAEQVEQTRPRMGARVIAGAGIGFVVAFAAVTGGLLSTQADPLIAWGAGIFSAIWGGVSIGATVGLSHHVASSQPQA